MSWRHISGDRLFLEMWEPHQSSSFILDIIMWIYKLIVPSMTGIAIVANISGLVLYSLSVIVLYKELKKRMDHNWVKLVLVFLLTFRAKNILLPEFSNMQIAFSFLAFTEMLKLEEKDDLWTIIKLGIFTSLEVLAYPTTAISVIPVFIFILSISSSKIRSLIGYFGTCLCMGGGYLAIIQRKVGLNVLWSNISSIFSSDSSHSSGIFNVTTGWTFDIRYDYSYIYLIVIVIGFWGISYLTKSEKKLYFAGMGISLASFVAVVMLTNQSISSVFPYLILACVISVLPISKLEKQTVNFTVVSLFILFIVGVRGLFIDGYAAETNNGFITNAENIIRVGPTKGIIASLDECNKAREGLTDWNKNVSADDSVLAVGGWLIDSSVYLYTDASIANYSTIDTTTYNEKLLEYWDKNPLKYPSVIAVEGYQGEDSLGDDSWIAGFIKENYDVSGVGTFWTFYRSKQ